MDFKGSFGLGLRVSGLHFPNRRIQALGALFDDVMPMAATEVSTHQMPQTRLSAWGPITVSFNQYH